MMDAEPQVNQAASGRAEPQGGVGSSGLDYGWTRPSAGRREKTKVWDEC